jgi:hypothetical protein
MGHGALPLMGAARPPAVSLECEKRTFATGFCDTSKQGEEGAYLAFSRVNSIHTKCQ